MSDYFNDGLGGKKAKKSVIFAYIITKKGRRVLSMLKWDAPENNYATQAHKAVVLAVKDIIARGVKIPTFW